jgi:hypothetical protein
LFLSTRVTYQKLAPTLALALVLKTTICRKNVWELASVWTMDRLT